MVYRDGAIGDVRLGPAYTESILLGGRRHIERRAACKQQLL